MWDLQKSRIIKGALSFKARIKNKFKTPVKTKYPKLRKIQGLELKALQDF